MLNRTWEYDDLFRVDRLIFSALFIVVCARRFASIRDVVSLIRELALVLLALLLGYASSLYPWYVAWLLPMAALTDSGPLRRTILVFSVSVFALYAFPYAMLEESPHRMVWRGMRLVAAFGVPIGFGSRRESRSRDRRVRVRRHPRSRREVPELLRVHPPHENARPRLTYSLLLG
jgi:hypothetical protein